MSTIRTVPRVVAPSLCVLLLGSACGEENGESQPNDSPLTMGSSSSSAMPNGSVAGPSTMAPIVSCDDVITDGQLVITDDTNYSFSNTITVERHVVKDATDLLFDWGSITTDFFGKPVDAAQDIKMLLISLWEMTPEELEENIRIDNLPLSVNKGAISTFPDGTSTSENLTDFVTVVNDVVPEEQLWSFFDTSHERFQYPQDTHTFLLMASAGTIPGKEARMLSFFTLDPTSENTEVVMTNDSAHLDFSATLTRAAPVPVPAGTSALTIDWREMTTNALGNEYFATQITEAVVAHYSTLTLTDLEQQFLDLEELADGWWSGEVTAGVTMDLSTLVDESGNAFPGVDDNGTWLVALFCTANCNNPAPWSITILQSCGG